MLAIGRPNRSASASPARARPFYMARGIYPEPGPDQNISDGGPRSRNPSFGRCMRSQPSWWRPSEG